jgi:hypothetical protein
MSGGSAVNWIERKPPKKFDFAEGAVLVGILVSHETGMLRDKQTGQPKKVNRYTVEDQDSKETVFFHGTVQLDSMLRPNDVGHFVSVTCTGEDKEAGRNKNAMKLFKVLISERAAPGWADDGSRIMDADLPDDMFMA